MKKLKKAKFLIIMVMSFCFINTEVYAKTMIADEIQGPAYVIGSHVFTREVNEETGYDGRLTTNLIMLVSKTIESSDLDSMIIYYKTATGMWINGLTGKKIEAPESFEINYTNLQLEEDNNTVDKPITPILYTSGPDSINKTTDISSTQISIFIDDIDNSRNKVDGIEYTYYISNGNGKIDSPDWMDLQYTNNFNTITSILDNFTITNEHFAVGNINIGKSYHTGYIKINHTLNANVTINVRSYNVDANGKKTYSDIALMHFYVNDILPYATIVSEYSNPNYIEETEDHYIYRLGIEQPSAYMFFLSEKFAYIVYEVTENSTTQLGVFDINETFNATVKKNAITKYYAQLGYYDVNGDFQHYITPSDEEYKIYYTIDTRTLTAPVLYYNAARDYVGPSSTPESISLGEYIYINDEFYKNQEENTLDYQIEGAEIYRVFYESGTLSNPGSKPVYELIADNSGHAHVYPPGGSGFYTARVYATNEVGEKVYSDFSELIGVVRTPLISASEVVDGKVTITIENIDEYRKGGGIEFTLYATVDPTNEEVELASILYEGDQSPVFEIEVTENMEIYADASIHDWVNSTDEKKLRAYSYASNGINIVVE